ncbi:MAG TPA: aldehyde ferredoxin oxidoreductase C-terminal domain-containing protein [Thermodesulfobacteriota bacterium]|nr:aldehyde ferredoxin oxidoreductase C-terminal domain-containing protein [Thermodesulfobacteriota bacterium]
MPKILRVNLSDLKTKIEDLPKGYDGLGGRALTSAIVSKEVSPRTDPLGPENKLIFSAGILAGTTAPNNSRLSVGAKSPLTHTIKEANSGGAVAQKLVRLGLQAVVIEGTAKDLTSLKIDKDGVRLVPATSYRNLGNYQAIEKVRKEFGDNIGVISIGPAGEWKLKAAAVAVTTPDFHIRVAARGGLGAVMGSKNLKAVMIDDARSDQVEIKDKARFREASTALSKGILSHPLIGIFKEFGTSCLVMMMNAYGCLATKNYSLGQFAGAEKISGEHMLELMKKRPNAQHVHRCMNGCIINCSNIFTGENGETIVSGLEYETIGLVGSNCMIDDIDIVAQINRVCNDVGVDTMDVGGAIGVAMEAGLLAWGDGKAALDLVKGIEKKTEKGLMIGNGCKFTGEKLGAKRIPHVKGQCLAAYDPRSLKGTGVTYATSPMGADHTCGNAIPNPANPSYNPSAATGQGPVSQFLQSYFAAIDSLGLCLFASLPLLDIPELQKHLVACVSAKLGAPLDENYLTQLGVSTLKAERTFNEAAGFTKKDDRLPKFFLEEKLPPSGNIFDVPEAEIDGVSLLS